MWNRPVAAIAGGRASAPAVCEVFFNGGDGRGRDVGRVASVGGVWRRDPGSESHLVLVMNRCCGV